MGSIPLNNLLYDVTAMSGIGGLEGSITFFYYDDLAAAAGFYETVMGFETVVDVKFAKVYKVAEGSHIGIVDGNLGSMKATKDKPVMFTVLVDDADSWYSYLMKKGANVEGPPRLAEYLKMKVFLLRDPEGYVLEILEWLKKPYGH